MAKGKYEYWLSEEGLMLLEGWARDGLTDEQIAKNIGISRSTLNEWKNNHPDISDTLKKGKEVVDRQVENALFKKALGYIVTETTKERIVDSGQKKRHKEHQALTEIEWNMAIKYFGGKCCYCGNKMLTPTKDHIIPLSAGGKLEVSNVIPCCQSCNSSKKDNEMQEWFEKQAFYSQSRMQKICDYIEFASTFNLGNNLVITKETKKEIPPDTLAQIFWLKNRKPDKWRDKPEEKKETNNGILDELTECLKHE